MYRLVATSLELALRRGAVYAECAAVGAERRAFGDAPEGLAAGVEQGRAEHGDERDPEEGERHGGGHHQPCGAEASVTWRSEQHKGQWRVPG